MPVLLKILWILIIAAISLYLGRTTFYDDGTVEMEQPRYAIGYFLVGVIAVLLE